MALRIVFRYRAQRLDHRGSPIAAPLETMVDHNVVDPVVGFARRVAGDC
jgi:hypothetical protein